MPGCARSIVLVRLHRKLVPVVARVWRQILPVGESAGSCRPLFLPVEVPVSGSWGYRLFIDICVYINGYFVVINAVFCLIKFYTLGTVNAVS